MDHRARIKLNLEGNGKSYFIWNETEEYYKRLRSAYSDLKKDDSKNYTFFGFFTLCAATLEYSLNYLLADYCFLQYGPKKCDTFIQGYTWLGFKKKLHMTPSIISNGELLLNEDHTSYKKLNELINLRNNVLHGKASVNDFKSPNFQNNDQEKIEFDLELNSNPINKLDKEKCLEYADAISDFKKLIMEPWFEGKFKENELLKQNTVKANS